MNEYSKHFKRTFYKLKKNNQGELPDLNHFMLVVLSLTIEKNSFFQITCITTKKQN